MVFLVFVRVVQGYFSVNQLGTYQGFITASTSVDEVQTRFGNVHLLSAELLTEAIEYSNAVLQKDPERSEESGKKMQEVMNDLRNANMFGIPKNLPVDVLKDLSDTQARTKNYIKLAEILMAVPADAPTVIRDAQRAVVDDFDQRHPMLESVAWRLAQRIAAIQGESETARADFQRAILFGQTFTEVVAIAAIIWFYTILNKGFGRLEFAIRRIKGGDFSARAEMTGEDELSTIGQNFDRLLNERLVSEAIKRQENEAMNESAITLLGAVLALSDRDLRVRAPVDDNIVGTIASSINQLAEETAQALGSVQALTLQLEQATQETRQQAQEVDRAIAQEQFLLKGMQVTLADTSAQLLGVAQLSQRTTASAGRTANAAAAAQDAVEGTVQGMNQLRQVMGDTEKRFKSLAQRSQEISTAVALINTISERTHVLSLNASIQAAAAGDAGRGFAVVAQEVQRLSDASSKAANEIAAMVDNIQAEANESLVNLNRLVTDVVSQTSRAESAAREMQLAQSATEELIAMVGHIAASSEVQQELAASLRQSIDEINQSTLQTSASMSAQKAWTSTLVDYAQGLRDSVADFTLDQPTPSPTV
jgi:methyl-accepting chemotaxis protein